MNPFRLFADRIARLGLLALGAAVALAAPAAWADPPTRAARLSYITGPVALAPAGLPDEWGEAFVNRPITIGDRLWTDVGGRAELRLGATALRIDGGTSLDVLDLDDRMLQVSIDQGRTQVRTRGGRGGDAEIDTPAAAVVITGAADVRIDVDAGTGRTFIAVRHGRANIYTQYASFDLASGETSRIDVDGRYYTIGRAGPRDAFDNFAYTRDVRWREPRYVSVEMTGYEDLDQYGAWQPVADYGTVWFPRQVANDWVPYRDGRWVWVEPWGWTWVDNAPWGFAPFHYGRWVQVNNRWGWWPGERTVAPVYAPALVAFFGGDNFSISVSAGSGPAVGWFPLGYNDPYIPWYTASPTYRRAVNVAYVRDPVIINQVVNVTNVNVTTIENFRYRHRDRPNAATAVPRQVFVSAQPVRQAAVAVAPQRVASAPIVVGAAPVVPERASFLGRGGRADRAPRGDRANKPVVAVNAPAAAPPRFEERVQSARREEGRPFEVKPLRDDRREARRDDRQDAQRSAGAQPGAAPQPGAGAPATAAASTTTAAPTGRELRVIRPAPTESREARDRGAGKGSTAQGRQGDDDRGRGRDQAAQGQEAPRAGATPPQALPPQAAQQAQDRAVPAQGLPPQAAPQAQDRAAPMRDGQQPQREAQERGNQQREQQQRAAQEREQQQREAQERGAQQREQQQRAAQDRANQQREAQERANQQREQQQRAAQEREQQQREAQERGAQQREQQQRAAQDRANQQREAQERANQQREQQQRAAQDRANQQREAQERASQQREQQQRAAQDRAAQQQAQQAARAQPQQAQPQQGQPRGPQQAQGQGQGRADRDDRDDRDERGKGKDKDKDRQG